MPANLPPQYLETERKLKTAKTPQEKMAILEVLLAIVPKHKGTEKLQALLKTKIAKLKQLSAKDRRSPDTGDLSNRESWSRTDYADRASKFRKIDACRIHHQRNAGGGRLSVHKDFASKLRYARIWNTDKFQGQKVNRDYELQDEDIIELHI